MPVEGVPGIVGKDSECLCRTAQGLHGQGTPGLPAGKVDCDPVCPDQGVSGFVGDECLQAIHAAVGGFEVTLGESAGVQLGFSCAARAGEAFGEKAVTGADD